MSRLAAGKGSRLAVMAVVCWFSGAPWVCPARGGPGSGGVQAANALDPTGAAIVINELHTDPDIKTERVEFVELYNAGTVAVDLSGWQFTDGVFYTFPPGTQLPAGDYLIVAQDPAAIHAKWSAGRARLPARSVFGPYAGALNNQGETVVLCDAGGAVVDRVEYQLGFPWPTVGDAKPEDQPGTGHSMQLVNPAYDNDLGGSWRSALPTPVATNRVLHDNLPPHIRQVNHSPRQPHSGQPVIITAKVTDPDGVAGVVLNYQLVEPGAYVTRSDPLYARWTAVAMHDDGLNGDMRAHDDVYTVELPAALQTHRRLVRYRIALADAADNKLLVPYADDPQPNFAYFVYDGVPAWRGAVQPGVTPVVEFPPAVMGKLPVYHLLAKKADIEDCTWFQKYGRETLGRKEYRWLGTLVYDGTVYDHIRFRARGGMWRHAMGKNPWKMDFTRGHALQAHDDHGRPYQSTWDTLNLAPCIQQGNFGQRGEQGMFEAVSFRLFNLAGSPAARTNYLHFRIIDEAFEDGARNAAHPPLTTAGTQYDGDFWGLYLALEQMDGRFLDEFGLPDGNLYKMDYTVDELNNQGPTQPSDGSDLVGFLNSYRWATEDWWRTNVNLPSYYGYYAIYHAIHHGDLTDHNWYAYHCPEPDQWYQFPWDLDLTWTTYYITTEYGGRELSDPFSRAGVLQYPALSIECKNRLREIIDLLFNPEQTGRLIDEYAAVIDDPAGGLSLVDADRTMWDYHWVMNYTAYPQYLSYGASQARAGQGRFYLQAQQKGYGKSFEGMVKVMKDFVAERMSYLRARAADAAIPYTPTVTVAAPAGFPSNALRFTTTPFSDPQGAGTFAALRWRLADVTTEVQPVGGSAGPSTGPGVDLLPAGAPWKYFKGSRAPAFIEDLWRQSYYDDSAWSTGETPIGFGKSFIQTGLDDMPGNYTTVYLRKMVNVSDFSTRAGLWIDVKYDDGVNVWINGRLAFQDNVPGESLPHTATAGASRENLDFVRRDLGAAGAWLTAERNVIAVQLLNAAADDADCFFDMRLLGSSAAGSSPSPSPGSSPVHREPPRYEIDPVWDSGELRTFQGSVTIPASAVEPGRTYRVRCRMKDNTGRWSQWSDPVPFVAGAPTATGTLLDLRLTEMMYHPPEPPAGNATDPEEYEFVEFKNTGGGTLDLRSVSFAEGISFDFGGSTVTSLGPGKFVLVVRNRPAFLSRYGAAWSGVIAGEYTGKLANGGEKIALCDTWNGTIAEFTYGDGRGWALSADGGGHSLVPLDAALPHEPQGSLNYPGNWRASTYIGGSPGRDDPQPPATVLINEFMANTSYSSTQNPTQRSNDWVELYNPTGTGVNLSGWYLSDDVAEPKKWALPAVTLPPHGFLSFDEVTGFAAQSGSGFGLSKDGEELLLSCLPGTAADRIVDAVRFKAQEADLSLGRCPDGEAFWFRLSPSRGAANRDPRPDAVIAELMYHPLDPDQEYVVLHNPLDRAVMLGTRNVAWRLDGAVSYVFPVGASIPAQGRLVVVGFDPFTDASRLAAFAAAYGLDPGAAGGSLVGPWTGNLANEGERLALEKSQPGDDPNDPVAWVIVDEVIYGNVPPWPTGADGQGAALHRIETDQNRSGNDPANWLAAPPSLGGIL